MADLTNTGPRVWRGPQLVVPVTDPLDTYAHRNAPQRWFLEVLWEKS